MIPKPNNNLLINLDWLEVAISIRLIKVSILIVKIIHTYILKTKRINQMSNNHMNQMLTILIQMIIILIQMLIMSIQMIILLVVIFINKIVLNNI